jgi:hypothetical protein
MPPKNRIVANAAAQVKDNRLETAAGLASRGLRNGIGRKGGRGAGKRELNRQELKPPEVTEMTERAGFKTEADRKRVWSRRMWTDGDAGTPSEAGR